VKYLHKFTLLLMLVGVLTSGTLTAEEVIHIVARGETIFSLSRTYGVSADELMRVNNITDPSTLQAGRRLVIPRTVSPGPDSPNLRDYRAVRGDTLFGIARNHGISLQRLLEINRFAPNHVLRVGDVIKVPAVQGSTAGQTGQVPSAQGSTTPNPATVNVPVSGIYSLRWPITPKDITYMTGQMGVVVEGELLESVKSLTQGNVVSAGPWRKIGRVVIVESAGGYYYMYGGLESLSVSVGTRITPGMEVGKLGLNAVSDKPQLFFMVFRNDTPIDPAAAPRAAAPRVSIGDNDTDSVS
jgi:murein DD-endopeptidase MepM/ murein hydrolase activator NlpD